uniref:Transcription elongation factor 1 homolog n=1 Tax=Aegilops tauschii TaxID=37682 RepID=N1R446_AEGTA
MASRKKPAPKLDTAFCCPFCNHPGGVACTIDLKLYVASAVCYVCEEAYHTTAHHLTEPVDVYHDWIDACEMANQDVDAQAGDCYKPQRRRGRRGQRCLIDRSCPVELVSGKQQVQTWKRGRINPEVKRAQAGVVRGWVTVREV